MAAPVGGYRLIRRLRAGGMAEVYVAELPSGERVAIKRLLPHLEGHPRCDGWLEQEARIGAQLWHPNVVRLLGIGHEGRRGYLALELVDGLSLDCIRARARQRRRPASLAAVASLVAQAAAAIDYVHRAGVVHGDVTPANLLVSLGARGDRLRSGAGVLKLCDFGVARERGQPARWPRAGNPAYVAPEQARGEPGDQRSDIFSLAVCAWELLAGRRLFARRTAQETLRAVRRAEIPVLPQLVMWPRLGAVMRAALAHHPDERLCSARALGDAFVDWLLGHGCDDDALRRWLSHLGEPAAPPAAMVLERTETITA